MDGHILPAISKSFVQELNLSDRSRSRDIASASQSTPDLFHVDANRSDILFDIQLEEGAAIASPFETRRTKSTSATRSSYPLSLPHTFPPPQASCSLKTPTFQRFHSHMIRLEDPSDDSCGCCRRHFNAPLLLWIVTSLAFVLGITVWRTELFDYLDNLAHYLQDGTSYGYIIIFLCIFATTFPPVPLYSTFIVLSGYTFGAWRGFVISYAAALSGALVVYLLSFYFLRRYLMSMLSTAWIKHVVQSIEKKPQLLLLIRIAPYPYNLLNSVLAVSDISFRTYVSCTAISLFKLIIHTTAGSTIHHFAEYHTHKDSIPEDGSQITRIWYIVGLGLCIGIFVYISYLARQAVGEGKDDDTLSSLENANMAERHHWLVTADAERPIRQT